VNEIVQAIDAVQSVGFLPPQQAPSATAAPGFAGWVDRELAALNSQLVSAEQGLRTLATGSAENLHDVMLQMEQARLALQLAMQVRTKVIEAYQDVMRMQV
jgi:flagellar hook-basal body complex protein FliE